MRTNVRIKTSLLSLCFLCGVGCKKIVEEAARARDIEADAVGPATAEMQRVDEDQALGEKLNGYIRDCLNRFSRPVRSSEERYYSWVDPRKGPAARNRKVNGIDEIALDPTSCRSAVDRSNARPPKHREMEEKASAYAGSVLELVPIVNEAHRYYEQGDYKTDKMTKGKKLHPKLIAVFSAFDKADADLARVIDQVQEDLDRRELLRIEREEGKRGRWHVVRTTVAAKPLLHESAKEPSTINVAAVAAALEGYQSAVFAFESWAQESPADANKVGKFLVAAKELVAPAKSLVRRLGDKKPFSAPERRRMGTSAGLTVEGSPDAVLDKYNRLIEAYNVVRY